MGLKQLVLAHVQIILAIAKGVILIFVQIYHQLTIVQAELRKLAMMGIIVQVAKDILVV